MSKRIELEDVVLDYNTASTRLIVLDHDGCLVPLELYPELMVPGDELKTLIKKLAADTRNQVIIISGRTREDLDSLWPRIPVVLSAEYGGYYKNPGNAWFNLFSRSTDWIDKTFPCINALAFQYEGSFVERKTYSLSWHYRAIAEKVLDEDKSQILSALRSIPEHEHFTICDDRLMIELRTPGINKGSFLTRWIGTRKYDFIMAMGDGETNGDMFKVLQDDAFVIKVGDSKRSTAKYYLENQQDVLPFLENLVNVNHEFSQLTSRAGLRRL